MGERMAGAEMAAWRHLLGLTLDELAEALAVNVRTTRSWESGRDPIPLRIDTEVATLVVEHGELAARMVDDGRPVAITRDKAAPSPRPRGWYVAAAARALAVEPGLMVEWA